MSAVVPACRPGERFGQRPRSWHRAGCWRKLPRVVMTLLHPSRERMSCSIVVEPLNCRDEPLGFIMLDGSRSEGQVYHVLQEQIGSALKGVLLLQENVRLYHAALAAQEAAQEKQHLAEEANRLKSRFLSMVSHELRTPLILLEGLERDDAARGLGRPAALAGCVSAGSGAHSGNCPATGRAGARCAGPCPQPGWPVAAGNEAARHGSRAAADHPGRRTTGSRARAWTGKRRSRRTCRRSAGMAPGCRK